MLPKNNEQTLHIAKGHILALLFLPVLLPCILIYFNLLALLQNTNEDLSSTYIPMVVLLLGSVCYLYYALSFKLTLAKNSLHFKSLFTNKTILVEALNHYKIDQVGIHIFQKDRPNSPVLIIPRHLDNLPLLMQWLEQYSHNPELEAAFQVHIEELKEFSENDAYGKNKIEKKENLAAAHRIATWLNRCSFLLLLWVIIGQFFFSSPAIEIGYFIAILLPFVLVYYSIRYKGFFSLDFESQKIDPFPSTGLTLLYCSIILLAYWLLGDQHIVHYLPVLFVSIIISLVISIPILYTSRDLQFKKASDYLSALIIVFMMTGYGYGLLLYGNASFNNSPAKVYPLKLLQVDLLQEEDHVVHITLPPWHIYTEATEIQVPRHLFNHSKKGETVHVHLKTGNLGIEYYSVFPE